MNAHGEFFEGGRDWIGRVSRENAVDNALM